MYIDIQIGVCVFTQLFTHIFMCICIHRSLWRYPTMGDTLVSRIAIVRIHLADLC